MGVYEGWDEPPLVETESPVEQPETSYEGWGAPDSKPPPTAVLPTVQGVDPQTHVNNQKLSAQSGMPLQGVEADPQAVQDDLQRRVGFAKLLDLGRVEIELTQQPPECKATYVPGGRA